jgi:peptidoglycan/LPS O-acetylase OafA/YrhL
MNQIMPRYKKLCFGGNVGKFKYLDGLRGLAALIVVVDHFFFAFFPFAILGSGVKHHFKESLLYHSPLYLLINGDLSVCVFYALSGFVLSAKFFRTSNPEFIRSSAVKRYFRLGIPITASVIISFVLLHFGLYRNGEVSVLSGSDWFGPFWQFQSNLAGAFKQGLYGSMILQDNSYNSVLWSMHYELFGSFLIFITLLIFGRMRNRGFFYVGLCLAFIQTYYLPFILGVMLCDFFFSESFQGLKSFLNRGGWIFLLLISLLVGAFPGGEAAASTIYGKLIFPGWNLIQMRILAHSLGAAGIFFAVMASRQLINVLSSKIMIFFGRISFAVYLLHFMVLGSLSSYLFLHLQTQFGYRTSFAITFCISVIATIDVAYLFTKHVDDRALVFANFVYSRWFSPRPSAKVKRDEVSTIEKNLIGDVATVI